jgi:hypothetical protein
LHPAENNEINKITDRYIMMMKIVQPLNPACLTNYDILRGPSARDLIKHS